MHIICPHCTTSYAIDLATLGGAGRTVRCSRCKEVWLARPQDAVDMAAPVPAMAEAAAQGDDGLAEWEALAREDDNEARQIPVVDSPSISGDLPGNWPSVAQDDALDAARPRRQPWFHKLLRPQALLGTPGSSFNSPLKR